MPSCSFLSTGTMDNGDVTCRKLPRKTLFQSYIIHSIVWKLAKGQKVWLRGKHDLDSKETGNVTYGYGVLWWVAKDIKHHQAILCVLVKRVVWTQQIDFQLSAKWSCNSVLKKNIWLFVDDSFCSKPLYYIQMCLYIYTCNCNYIFMVMRILPVVQTGVNCGRPQMPSPHQVDEIQKMKTDCRTVLLHLWPNTSYSNSFEAFCSVKWLTDSSPRQSADVFHYPASKYHMTQWTTREPYQFEGDSMSDPKQKKL